MDEKKHSSVVVPQFEAVEGCATLNEFTQLISLWSKLSLHLLKETEPMDLTVPPEMPPNSAHFLNTTRLIRDTILRFSDEYKALAKKDKESGLIFTAQHIIESSRDGMDFNHDE